VQDVTEIKRTEEKLKATSDIAAALFLPGFNRPERRRVRIAREIHDEWGEPNELALGIGGHQKNGSAELQADLRENWRPCLT